VVKNYQWLLRELSDIEDRIGLVFKDKTLLALAFIHRSFFNENRQEIAQHNERLEFLGDSVLGLVMADYLYELLPDESEGQLSLLRASLVEASMCAQFVQKLGLEKFILLGKGEKMQEGCSKSSIQADFFEALLGAIYLEAGLSAGKKFILSHFSQEIANGIKSPLRNWKAELQDYFQKNYQKLPTYKVLQESGPDHSKSFELGVFFEEVLLGKGVGSSKKEAEQKAAKEALMKATRKQDG
jgi:ribonuclease III